MTNWYGRAWRYADPADRAMAIVFAGYWLTFLYLVIYSPPWHNQAIAAGVLAVAVTGSLWSWRRWHRNRLLLAQCDQLDRAVQDVGGWDELQPAHRQRIDELMRSCGATRQDLDGGRLLLR